MKQSLVIALVNLTAIAGALLWAGWKRSRIVEPDQPEGDVPAIPNAMKRGG